MPTNFAFLKQEWPEIFAIAVKAENLANTDPGTVNKDARFLMDEYRRISNEYLWKFEMSTARENQPLQTPGLIDALDSYLARGEISDPPHLLSYLTELLTDERLPLLARNHVSRLIKQIEKLKSK